MRSLKRILAGLLCCGALLLGGCGAATGSQPQTGGEGASSLEADMPDQPALAVTSVAICEILDELDYDNVIGIPETSSQLPERYAGVNTIGAPMTPDYEILKSLEPDLVLSPQTLESSLAADYTAAGLSSAFLDLSSVAGMYQAITSLGELLDRQQQAQTLVDDYESYMADYQAANGEEGPSVLLLMCFPDGFYLVATEQSYVGNLVELAGGVNVYSGYEGDQSGFATINPEDMVQKDPDKILVFAHYSEEAAFAYMEDEFETNPAWQYYQAVEDGEIYYLPSSCFGMSATLSWTEALDYLQPVLYGG